MSLHQTSALVCIAVVFIAVTARTDEPRSAFQTAADYAPELDIAADLAMLYGVNASFPDRYDHWKAQGYRIALMTGISWGDYSDYYGSDIDLRVDEIQTRKNGERYMHGDSSTVGYNVPSPDYVDFIKGYISPAIERGVEGLYLEEPEFWAESGWSEGFKSEWKRIFGEDWRAPDSSVDAQWKASRLKYQLYHDALREVFAHARSLDPDIACYVPTHSLINYAHWRIVSPMASLLDIPGFDGYIAQVWTGTSRTPNQYKGEMKERTFETAFLEYGQMLHLAESAGKKVWLLHDPIEDHPDRSWVDYRENYEATVVASLLWPASERFEVMPWPSRIFRGKRPLTNDDIATDTRVGIPADYAVEVLTVINALNDIGQYRGTTSGPRVGVVVSDTMMFQRAAPHASDPALGSFYGIALPLVKRGIHVRPVQLETIAQPGALAEVDLLFLSYEGQKPLTPAYHDALEAWVRGGGTLIYIGDGSDPYHHVAAWWNDDGATSATPVDDLITRFRLKRDAWNTFESVGEGRVRVLADRPRRLAMYPQGDTNIAHLLEAADMDDEAMEPEHAHFLLRRGPYVVAATMQEFAAKNTVDISGQCIDLFDPTLPVLRNPSLRTQERRLLYDLHWLDEQNIPAQVVAASTRVRTDPSTDSVLRFTTRGPRGTLARLRVRLPGIPEEIRTLPTIEIEQSWDADSRTLYLAFENTGQEISFEFASKSNIR